MYTNWHKYFKLMADNHLKKKNVLIVSNSPKKQQQGKNYTQKELALMETSIEYFHWKFYIPYLKNLVFHFPHILILVTHHWGKERCEAF